MTQNAALKNALEIILSGRSIDAETAKRIGLVDEIADADVLPRAVELARNYLLSEETSPIKDAHETRLKSLATWEQSSTFPNEVLNDPEIKRIISQLNWSGRAKAVEKILNAIQIGFEQGISEGIKKEAEYFAEAVVAKDEGKAGIEAFLEKKSKPLPTRFAPEISSEEESRLIAEGDLLPIDAAFYAGITKLPKYQYAMAITKSRATGEALHDDPIRAEKKVITPVENPAANDVLLYMLTSEINFNDIWGITGIPVSQFEQSDKDVFVVGSGGIGLVAATGDEVRREGRLKVGDLVVLHSGQNELLSPLVGNDPMLADFRIQGYETGDGSHQQFMIAQAPQCHRKPQDLTLEAAGSYILNLATIYRALFTTLKIEPHKSIFIEGAATGTGLEALKMSMAQHLSAIGLVSNPDRAAFVKSIGAKGVINRKDKRFEKAFTRVPEKETEWKAWEKRGETIVTEFKKQNGGKLADYAISHAGEQSFPRTFQLLASGGTVAFYGASSGYHFTFIGKKGSTKADDMLKRIGFRSNESVLMYYGVSDSSLGKTRSGSTLGGARSGKSSDAKSIVDEVGLEIIETLRERGARLVVACYTNAQREFVQSLGFGDSVKGVISIEDLQRRYQSDFEWTKTMKPMPDPKTETEAFKDAVREFNDKVFKPFATDVGKALRSPDNPRGYPDVVFERANHDALSVSTTIVKPFTGRVIYCEDMGSRRYSFYAPQVWMRQRRIYMPTANIWGTHMSNAYEATEMNALIDANILEVSEPLVVSFDELPTAHQEMWENRHRAGNYVCNHALPQKGLKSKEELYTAWSLKK